MKSDDLDRFLDASLAGYSGEEPRPGLEQRVLARIQAAGTPRRIGWRWIAIPVFASLLLLAIVYRTLPRPAIPEPKILEAQPPVVAVQAAAPLRPRPIVRRAVTTRHSLPKREVFPVPSPLTSEERALVNLVSHFPEQAREMLITATERSREPITVPRIEIPPLPDGSER